MGTPATIKAFTTDDLRAFYTSVFRPANATLIIAGDVVADKVVPLKDVQTLVDKLKTQKGIKIDQSIIHGANHFFESGVDELIEVCSSYVDRRLAMETAA